MGEDEEEEEEEDDVEAESNKDSGGAHEGRSRGREIGGRSVNSRAGPKFRG